MDENIMTENGILQTFTATTIKITNIGWLVVDKIMFLLIE